jgi:cysteine sulfinate desulfinase/cysteine desulfurase-like protein
MGLSPEVASASVRFSVGLENTAEEIDEAIRRIAHCVSRLRSLPVQTALHG